MYILEGNAEPRRYLARHLFSAPQCRDFRTTIEGWGGGGNRARPHGCVLPVTIRPQPCGLPHRRLSFARYTGYLLPDGYSLRR